MGGGRGGLVGPGSSGRRNALVCVAVWWVRQRPPPRDGAGTKGPGRVGPSRLIPPLEAVQCTTAPELQACICYDLCDEDERMTRK